MRNGLDEPTYEVDEKELKDFCALNKLTPYKVNYHCYDDCKMSGCPGHTAVMRYHHVTEGYTLDFGEGQVLSLDGTQMQIVADFIDRLTNNSN